MGLVKRDHNLTFMRKSNILASAQAQPSRRQAREEAEDAEKKQNAEEEDEEDPLDAYMREMEEQAGFKKTCKADVGSSRDGQGAVKFCKGETLGNVQLADDPGCEG